MELRDSFVVPASAETLWGLLTDVERIAPCVPGFELLEVVEQEFRGRMKVKVGAIAIVYEVTISFVERDDAARRAVLSVRGNEKRGSGSVNATVISTLTERGDQTVADMVTNVNVTGRVAQFGRGIMADVSSRVVEQFVACLNDRILNPTAIPTIADAGDAEGLSGFESTRSAGDVAALDLGSAAAWPVLKRLAPFVIGLVLGRLSARRGKK